MSGDEIPCDGEHRGIPLHAGQGAARLDRVRADIDSILAEDDPGKLDEAMGDISLAPEARILACRKLQALDELALRYRTRRPDSDMILVGAFITSLSAASLRSTRTYTSIYDVGPRPLGHGPQPVEREHPLSG